MKGVLPTYQKMATFSGGILFLLFTSRISFQSSMVMCGTTNKNDLGARAAQFWGWGLQGGYKFITYREAWRNSGINGNFYGGRCFLLLVTFYLSDFERI